MSCREAEDLNTLVGKLASLMTDTMRSCIMNYKALLPYLRKKETNSEVRHKLVRVNVLLNKLNEELLALRVEYVSVMSYKQNMETVLSEGVRKRTASNVPVLDRHEIKSIKMEVPFSNNTKCSVALKSEAGINIHSHNLLLNNAEETRHSQQQPLDMKTLKNIKKEIEDSNEAEVINEFPRNHSQIPLVQESCYTTNNEMSAHCAGEEISASEAGRLVGSNVYDKSTVTITRRENSEVCVPLQSVENQISNQLKCEVGMKNIKKEIEDSNEVEHELTINNISSVAKKSCDTINNDMSAHFACDEISASVADRVVGSNGCDKSAVTINNEVSVPSQSIRSETSNQVEDCDNVLSKDHDIYKGLKGENGSTTSFFYPAKSLFRSKDSPVSFTACEKECSILVDKTSNICNKGEGRSHHSSIRCKKDYVPARSRVDDILYGIIKIKNGMFRCTLCNRKLVCDMAVSCHVRGKQHEKARTTLKKNGCTKESVDVPYGILKFNNGRYRCTLCRCKLFCDTTMLGHVRGKQHQTALLTVKNNGCTKEPKIPNKRYKIEFVKAKEHNMKQKIVKSKKCSIKFEFPSNNSESTAQVSVFSPIAYSRADTFPSNSCGSTPSVPPCSAVPCSLADNVAVVEDRQQVISIKPAVLLNDIWTHFYAPFHINKKFFEFNSGQIICTLCYEQVGGYILNVRAHISGSSHIDRVNSLRNIELKNKSSNKQLLDIPGSLKNVVPSAHFSWSNNGFFCNVCNCFVKNTVVLSHMTAKSHLHKVEEIGKNNTELTNVTAREN